MKKKINHRLFQVLMGQFVAGLLITSACASSEDQLCSTMKTAPDGTVLSLVEYAYDHDGNIVEERYLDPMAGDVRSRNTYDYNANGNLVTEELWMADADVTFHRLHHNYDASGNRILTMKDSLANTIAEQFTTYTYNADGQLTAMDEKRTPEGAPFQRTSYSYGDNGLVSSEEVILLSSGLAPDVANVGPQKTIYTYDVYDQLVGIQIDKANDRFVDVITIMTYDALGNMLTEERTINEKPPEISAATTSPNEASAGPIVPSEVLQTGLLATSANSPSSSEVQTYRKTYAYS